MDVKPNKMTLVKKGGKTRKRRKAGEE